MTTLDGAAAALAAIGGVNWGLVGLKEFDLVAALTGHDFGEMNAASRAVYGLVGASALYLLTRLPALASH